MHDDDEYISLDDATLHALHVVKPDYKTMGAYIRYLEQQEAIPPQQTIGNDGVSSSLGSPCWPFPAAPSRPLYRLVERSRGEPPPAGYSVLSDVVRSIVNTREKLARWRSGQNGLLCARAKRLQMQREEWEA